MCLFRELQVVVIKTKKQKHYIRVAMGSFNVLPALYPSPTSYVPSQSDMMCGCN